jgi:hypothetical protein
MGVRSASAAGVLFLVLIASFPGNSAALQDAEASVSLEASHSWDFVLGMTEDRRDHPLEGILVYSRDGTTLVIPVEDGIAESTGELGIVVGTPTSHNLAPGAEYIEYTHYAGQSLLILLSGSDVEGASTLYEYRDNLELANEHEIPFDPKYVSNLWNGHSWIEQDGRLALAFADDHEIWMLNMCPPSIYDPLGGIKTYTDNITISNATILGNPLVVDGDFLNGSMLFVPTSLGLMAFDINVSRSDVTGDVLGIFIGEFRWMGDYFADGTSLVPISGNHTASFWYPKGSTYELGKEFVALAAEDSRVAAYDRETGDIVWSTRIDLEAVAGLEIDGVHGSPEGLAVTGADGQDGCLVVLDSDTGDILFNGTVFVVTEGRIVGSPEYVMGRLCYMVCTDTDRIIVCDLSFAKKFEYDFSDVGLSCVPRYLGNIYIEAQRSGNYIGVVTDTPELLVHPFIEYSEDIENEPDEPDGDFPWVPLAVVVVVAAAVIPVTLYFLSRRRRR